MIIEKDIPIPDRKRGLPKTSLVHHMEIGDSVLVETDQDLKKIKSGLYNIGFGSVQRREGEGHRVWCVEKKTYKKT